MALVCACAVFAAGCHRNNLTSGYGVVWLTLTDTPGDFASYIVNVDSITFTRNDGAVVTALVADPRYSAATLADLAAAFASWKTSGYVATSGVYPDTNQAIADDDRSSYATAVFDTWQFEMLRHV